MTLVVVLHPLDWLRDNTSKCVDLGVSQTIVAAIDFEKHPVVSKARLAFESDDCRYTVYPL
jgi:hypothetical protein